MIDRCYFKSFMRLIFADVQFQLEARINSIMGRRANKLWFCTLCGKEARDKQSVARHVEANHIDDHPGFNCNVCGMNSKTRTALQAHIRAYHKSKHHL